MAQRDGPPPAGRGLWTWRQAASGGGSCKGGPQQQQHPPSAASQSACGSQGDKTLELISGLTLTESHSPLSISSVLVAVGKCVPTKNGRGTG